MGRRIALRRPKREEVEKLDEKDEKLSEEQKLKISRFKRIPYMDFTDQKFRHFELVPNPTYQAVVFCQMDVSGSMDEYLKDLAKRYFLMLILFLQRSYPTVEVVFVRHTDYASEVSEEEFFTSRESGGTLVYSVHDYVYKAIQRRFPTNEWNVYIAQASDGDVWGEDGKKSVEFLNSKLLPIVQYMTYINVGYSNVKRATPLMDVYSKITSDKFAMSAVHNKKEIYPVFKELFKKQPTRS
jgi:uncharacterized sporulation protein YeaH/YhbH (DUF444 family)